jgi:hypothetical protein
VVWIPKRAVLSARNCALADALAPIHTTHGPDALLNLSLALLGEFILGGASRWAGYIRSLPHSPPPLALFWGLDDDPPQSGPAFAGADTALRRKWADLGVRAVDWIVGTEVSRELRGQQCGESGSRDTPSSLLVSSSFEVSFDLSKITIMASVATSWI